MNDTYRDSQRPGCTEEKVKKIVGFYYGMTTEQYKEIREMVLLLERKYKKIAILTAINTAILVMNLGLLIYLK